MVHKKIQQGYLVRLETGELLIQKLSLFAKETGIKSGLLTGLGSAQWIELGYYNLKKQKYEFIKIDQAVEIVNITGNISISGQNPMIHAHGAVSDKFLNTRGGHIKEAEIAATCEVYIRWFNMQIERKTDKASGLKLLDLG